MTKSYIRKTRNKRRVVLSKTSPAGLPRSERVTKRRLYWLPERCLYEPMMLFLFFVQYFSYTIVEWNRCILKAQQIQNIIKDYDNITQKTQTNGGILILSMSWDLLATKTSWPFLSVSSFLSVPLLMDPSPGCPPPQHHHPYQRSWDVVGRTECKLARLLVMIHFFRIFKFHLRSYRKRHQRPVVSCCPPKKRFRIL